jgi:hypothetical protein
VKLRDIPCVEAHILRAFVSGTLTEEEAIAKHFAELQTHFRAVYERQMVRDYRELIVASIMDSITSLEEVPGQDKEWAKIRIGQYQEILKKIG